MQAYLWVRTLGETIIRESGLAATILRPWYVLGPGRRWPVLIKPLYRLAEMIPPTRATAERLGLISIEQMILRSSARWKTPGAGPSPHRRRAGDSPGADVTMARPNAGNIFDAAGNVASSEDFVVLFESGAVRIERIVSHSHSSPAGFWYDQAEDEWVIVLGHGGARIHRRSNR